MYGTTGHKAMQFIRLSLVTLTTAAAKIGQLHLAKAYAAFLGLGPEPRL